jgi:hypothetical protein
MMMDELFSNIFVYLPIILIILFRILGTRNRAAGKGKPAAAEPAPAPASRKEKPPEQAGRPRKGSPRTNNSISRTALFPEAPLAAAAPEKPAGTGRAAGEGFPENLNYLPALKRAMVLAEIMGPPKALQGGRAIGFEPPGDRP